MKQLVNKHGKILKNKPNSTMKAISTHTMENGKRQEEDPGSRLSQPRGERCKHGAPHTGSRGAGQGQHGYWEPALAGSLQRCQAAKVIVTQPAGPHRLICQSNETDRHGTGDTQMCMAGRGKIPHCPASVTGRPQAHNRTHSAGVRMP